MRPWLVSRTIRRRPRGAKKIGSIGKPIWGVEFQLVDAEGKVAVWNQGATRSLGWSANEISGRDAVVFYPADAIEAGTPAHDLAERRRLERCHAARSGARVYGAG